jgi:hypothetical protein
MNKRTRVFTTGAYLEPVQIGEKFYWRVTQFEDDTFLEGEYASVQECGDTVEQLIREGSNDQD